MHSIKNVNKKHSKEEAAKNIADAKCSAFLSAMKDE
jgi:hypothetical protein